MKIEVMGVIRGPESKKLILHTIPDLYYEQQK